MTGLISYYHPERALADADGAHASMSRGGNLAAQAILSEIRGHTRSAPIGVFSPWARRSGIAWQTLEAPDHDLVLYPIAQADVTQANAHSYGYEVPWVGVLTSAPVEPKLADEVFDPTRYDLFETEGIYSVDDGHQTPRISFLYWAKLHEDVGGGKGSLDAVATRLGGVLVFPLHVPLEKPRETPALPFPMVLAMQISPPSIGADEPPPPPPKSVPLLAWAAIAGATGYVFWSTLRAPKKRRG